MLAGKVFYNHRKTFKNKDTVLTQFDGAPYLVTSLRQGHAHLIHSLRPRPHRS